MPGVRRRITAPKGLRPGEVTGKKPAKETSGDNYGLPWYYRGCTTCGLRFSTVQSAPREMCQDCRLGLYGHGSGRPLWDRNGDPVACCLTRSVPLTDPEALAAYRCAGPTGWWQCAGCKRAHPFDPAVRHADKIKKAS